MELPDISKSNCSRLVLPGLLYFTSLEEFLLGGFASYGRLELPPDPKQMAQPLQPSGPTVGLAMIMATFPHPSAILLPPPHLSASSIFFSSSLMGEGFLARDGWSTGEGASILSLLTLSSPPWIGAPNSPLPLSSFFGITFVLAIL